MAVLLLIMCLGTGGLTDAEFGVADNIRGAMPRRLNSDSVRSVNWIYGNVRGLSQARGDLRKSIVTHRPTFFAATETHLDGDPIKALIPWGYKVLARLNRTVHGGGLIIGCKTQVLADCPDLKMYNIKGGTEVAGIEWGGVHWILYYTPNTYQASLLIDMLQKYKEDHPDVPVVFIGDMNVHNAEWLQHSSGTDIAGTRAQEFAEMLGLEQLVQFPTRGENTLDLVLSDIGGVAQAAPPFGTSDHDSMYISFGTEESLPSTPVRSAVRNWHNAPWSHINGAVKRALSGWSPT